jgi:hypothetical protein
MMARLNGWPLLWVISAILVGWTGWVTLAGQDAVEATR